MKNLCTCSHPFREHIYKFQDGWGCGDKNCDCVSYEKAPNLYEWVKSKIENDSLERIKNELVYLSERRPLGIVKSAKMRPDGSMELEVQVYGVATVKA
jgi:hypothetical protein